MSGVRSSSKAALLALGTVACMFACPNSADAAIRMPFRSEPCAWKATHVVVVTEGKVIDGEVEVLESWKGDLKKGDRLSIPDLAAFAPEEERQIYDAAFEKRTKPPTHVTCSRMILYLIKVREKDEDGKVGKVVWRPAAGEGEMEVSAAWVEKEQVYVFAQPFNPGGRVLFSRKTTEKELREQVEMIRTTQSELVKVLSQSDSTKFTDGLLPLLKTKSSFLRDMVIGTAADAGSTALPAIRKIIQDDTHAEHHDTAVRAMAKAGGAAVGPELTDLLKEELAFWKKVGPDLKKGWRDGKDEQTQRLKYRLWRTDAILSALKKTLPAGCKDTVIVFRDFWRSLPQLTEADRFDKDCDAVLEELRRPTPPVSGSP